MSLSEQEFLAGFAASFTEQFIARLKQEGLVHDDRPLLTLDEAAARLGVSMTMIRELTNGVDGEPPRLATVKVSPRGHQRGVGMKGIRVEPREIDRFLEQARRAAAVRDE